MSILSAPQLVTVAQAAGFSNTGQYDHALTWAVAIALAESSGNTHAINLNLNNSIDRGLWQINSIHCPPYDANSLFTAAYNANAAFAISSHGHDFSPWSTFWNGSAERFYSEAAQAVAGQRNKAPVPVGGDVTTGTFSPNGGGTLFYQTVVWKHEHPDLAVTAGVVHSVFH